MLTPFLQQIVKGQGSFGQVDLGIGFGDADINRKFRRLYLAPKRRILPNNQINQLSRVFQHTRGCP